MTVTRTQGVLTTAVDFPDVTVTTFDVPRPETSPKEAAYAETVDHVTRPPALREFEGGHVIVDFPATLALPTVFVERVEVRKLLPTAQKGVAGPGGALFPSGAPSDETLVRTLIDRNGADDLPLDDPAIVDFFGNAKATSAPRGYPGVTLRSGEFLRVSLNNTSGGPLNAQQITASYKLGLNQSDTGKP
ncbi:MAG TPA: hypothetical protein VM013_07945 [Dehalococcoidia bacterium]|nr:hypothetical protein [Dehalococcoidia bacterium]